MRILYLGHETSPLIPFLEEQGEELVVTSEPLALEDVKAHRADFLLSYGYRHILRKPILDLFPGRAVNLHISFLPWNRGANPNFWSFFDNTPKGVSIHLIDPGVDTGDILIQKKVAIPTGSTLKSSYELLQLEIQRLFQENWRKIKAQALAPLPQDIKQGSCHRMVDFEKLSHLLTAGWDTPVEEIEKAGQEARGIK